MELEIADSRWQIFDWMRIFADARGFFLFCFFSASIRVYPRPNVLERRRRRCCSSHDSMDFIGRGFSLMHADFFILFLPRQSAFIRVRKLNVK